MNKWTSEERFEDKEKSERVLTALKERIKDYRFRVVPHPFINQTWLFKRVKI